MANFYRPVEVPEYCFLSEAVEWLAVGEVPECDWEIPASSGSGAQSQGEIEHRFSSEFMPESFQPRDRILWFERENFAFAGLAYREGYAKAAENYVEHHLAWREDQVEQLRSSGPCWVADERGKNFDMHLEIIKDHRATLRRFADDFGLVKEVEAAFAPHFDAAWSRIFAAAVEGRVVIEGLDHERWVNLKERQRIEDASRFVALPAAALTVTTDWRLNSVIYEYRDFVSLRCRTDEIADLLEPRLMQSPLLETRLCGSYLWSPETERDSKPRRGRAPALDWSVLRDRLLQTGQSGALPASKESCIYDLIVFAESTLGTKVARSTVQERLKAELDLFYPRHN